MGDGGRKGKIAGAGAIPGSTTATKMARGGFAVCLSR
jgi:hypothetical protein